MKCPVCNFISSDKRDICPKCSVDLRPHKKSVGLPISHPEVPADILRKKYREAAAKHRQKRESEKQAKREKTPTKKQAKQGLNKEPAQKTAPPTNVAVEKATSQNKGSWLSSLFSKKERAGKVVEEKTKPSAAAETPKENNTQQEDPARVTEQKAEEKAPKKAKKKFLGKTKKEETKSSEASQPDLPELAAALSEEKPKEIDLETATEKARKAMPVVAPEVLDLSGDDEDFDRALDTLIGNMKFDVEAVEVKDKTPSIKKHDEDDFLFDDDDDDIDIVFDTGDSEEDDEDEGNYPEEEEETFEESSNPVSHLLSDTTSTIGLGASIDDLISQLNDLDEVDALEAELENQEQVDEQEFTKEEDSLLSDDRLEELSKELQGIELEDKASLEEPTANKTVVDSVEDEIAETEEKELDAQAPPIPAENLEREAKVSLEKSTADEPVVDSNQDETPEALKTDLNSQEQPAENEAPTQGKSIDELLKAIESGDSEIKSEESARTSAPDDLSIEEYLDLVGDDAELLVAEAVEDEEESGNIQDELACATELPLKSQEEPTYELPDEKRIKELQAQDTVESDGEPGQLQSQEVVEESEEDEELLVAETVEEKEESADIQNDDAPCVEELQSKDNQDTSHELQDENKLKQTQAQDTVELKEKHDQEAVVEESVTILSPPIPDIGKSVSKKSIAEMVELLAEAYGITAEALERMLEAAQAKDEGKDQGNDNSSSCSTNLSSVEKTTNGKGTSVDSSSGNALPRISGILWSEAEVATQSLKEEAEEILGGDLIPWTVDDRTDLLFDIADEALLDPSKVEHYKNEVPDSTQMMLDNSELAAEFEKYESVISSQTAEALNDAVITETKSTRPEKISKRFIEGAPLPVQHVKVPVKVRIAAKAIDLSLALLGGFLITYFGIVPTSIKSILFEAETLSSPLGLPYVLDFAFYTILCWCALSLSISENQIGSLGKRLLNIQIVTKDGFSPSFKEMLVRVCAELTSSLTLGLGHLPTLSGHRGLHDILAGTKVVKEVEIEIPADAIWQ